MYHQGTCLCLSRWLQMLSEILILEIEFFTGEEGQQNSRVTFLSFLLFGSLYTPPPKGGCDIGTNFLVFIFISGVFAYAAKGFSIENRLFFRLTSRSSCRG